jgi:hypothetical protein
MFWKRWTKDKTETCADALYVALKKAVTRDGRIRVEDLISAAAAIVGEATIAAAGDFSPRDHSHVPGSRVFSTSANRLICDDKSLDQAPADTIVGTLRDKLRACGYGSGLGVQALRAEYRQERGLGKGTPLYSRRASSVHRSAAYSV